CALPQSRTAALDRLAIDLIYRPQTDRVIAERLAVARLFSCADAVRLAERLERFDEAVDLANACDRPDLARGSLIALGHYDEAAQVRGDGPRPGFDDSRVLAAVGAGRWRDAATLLAEDKAVGAGCFAAYLRSLAGEPLGALPSSDRTCRIVAGIA